MQAEKLIIDGVEYNVNIVFPSRLLEWEIVEGSNSGVSLSFRQIRDIGGTKYNYTMQIKARKDDPEAFDRLLDALSAPVPYHRVVMPYGQGTLEFDAAIRSGGARDYGVSGNVRRWDEMEIKFEAMEPQRKPGGNTWESM